MHPALFAWGSTGKINDVSQAIKTLPLKGEVLRMTIPPGGGKGEGSKSPLGCSMPIYGLLTRTSS